MHNLVSVWLVGGLATTATAASTVLNAIIAVDFTSIEQLSQVLRILLFVCLGFSFLGSLSLVYFTTFYVRNVKGQSLQRKGLWAILGFGMGVAGAAIAWPLVVLVWLMVELRELPPLTLGYHPIVWLAIWFGCWGVSLLSQLGLFVILGLWVNRHLKTQSTSRLDIDFGTRLPSKPQETVIDGHRVFISTHRSPAMLPQTPTHQRTASSRPDSSSQYSSSSKAPPSSSRTQLVGGNRSNKSSVDMGYPAGEATSIDSAFDRWDTSSVSFEMRAAVGSSPPVTRGGLETIPGSRPESPEEDAIDDSILPSSPQERSGSPRAITSDTATVLGDWSSSPSRFVPTSTPPSSPPNFSRPTSKQKNQAMIVPPEASMQEIIHPLFRASSPHPPPIATAGTTVTASPLANQPITPRTLANLRSHSKSSSALAGQTSKSTGHWRAMPSISQYSDRRPSTAGSHGPVSPPPGSPGPSIVDEEELPPILPGFVLSAGQRTSMLGYTSRKSLKRDRRGSQMSATH